jgi:hypothetical protein
MRALGMFMACRMVRNSSPSADVMVATREHKAVISWSTAVYHCPAAVLVIR